MAAIGTLAEAESIPPDSIEVIEYESAEWSDSCLGLGGPAESCLAVITPGWRIVLRVAGIEHNYRSDELGTQIRAE